MIGNFELIKEAVAQLVDHFENAARNSQQFRATHHQQLLSIGHDRVLVQGREVDHLLPIWIG